MSRTLGAPPAFLLALYAALAVACATPMLDKPTFASNECGSDTECGGGARCEAGICVATSGEIDALLVTVGPSSAASFGPGLSIPIDLTGMAHGAPNFPLELPELALIGGSVKLEAKSSPAGCVYEVGEDGSIPATIELTPTNALPGLPSVKYFGATVKVGGPTRFEFQMGAPRGAYDLYIRPSATGGCAPPPPLLVSSTNGASTVEVNLASPTPLTGTLLLPEGMSTEGWSVDIADAERGRGISTRWEFLPDGKFAVDYWRSPAPAVVRLQPPVGMLAPRAVWDLFALDLENDGDVVLDLRDVDFAPVAQEGWVEMAATADPVLATLWFRSTALAGLAPSLVSFETTVVSTLDGWFKADLLPGEYDVTIIPASTSPGAITETTWVVNSNGRVIEVEPRRLVHGQIIDTLRGTAVDGTNVLAEPVVGVAPSYVAQVFGEPELPSRVLAAVTDASGAFALGVDPGEFDLWARPDEHTGFAWFVAPHLDDEVPAGATMVLPLPPPIRLAGQMTDPNGAPVSQAIVRAYAYIDDLADPPIADKSTAKRVVQIAETRTTETGSYALLLPSAIWP